MLPEGLDPDDVVKRSGAAGYQKLIDTALPLADYKLYLIKKDKDFSDPVSRRKFVNQSITYLRMVPNAALREELLLKVRDISGISYESLKRDLESGTMASDVSTSKNIAVEIKQGTGTVRAERFILASLIFKKSYAEDFDFSLNYSSPIREKIADVLIDVNATAQDAYAAVGEEGAEELTVILAAGENVFGTEMEERYFHDCVKAVKKSNLQLEIDELNKLYKKETSLDKKQEIAELIQTKNFSLRKIK